MSVGVNDGADYGGGFYWAGGGTATNDQSPSTMGMIFPSPSSYFGVQLVCGKGTCTQPAQIAIGAFSLYVRETSGPGFNAPERALADGRLDQGHVAICRVSRLAFWRVLAIGNPQWAADRHEHFGPGCLDLASVRGAGDQSDR